MNALLTLLLLFSTVSPAHGSHFAVNDGRLKTSVDFWKSIYTQYTSRQGVIHDAKYIDLIYEVVDLEQGKSNAQQSKFHRKKWKDALTSLHKKSRSKEGIAVDSLDEVERKAYDLLAKVDEPNKYLAALHRRRLRMQVGLKDRFAQGIIESGRFLPIMEQIFKAEGLPLELTRLPFVESGFNIKARSKVGASGIWQFMRSTGRNYLSINESVDERNDPIRATEAAARKLRENYETLGVWPLAVTAYNHGRQGVLRAVRKVGSDDLEEIIDDYKSRTFGFASRNFYASLVAAIEVEREAEKHYGKLERVAKLEAVEVELPDSIAITHLIQFLKLDEPALRELNPGITEAGWQGKRRLHAGYRLRLPQNPKFDAEGVKKIFLAGYQEIPSGFKFASRKPNLSLRASIKRLIAQGEGAPAVMEARADEPPVQSPLKMPFAPSGPTGLEKMRDEF